jgi:hypothetical protein
VAFAWMSVALVERLRAHAPIEDVSTAEALAEIPAP